MLTNLGIFFLAEINPDDVTPGVIGFVFTALFAVAVILIGLDLYRRVRRTKIREEVRAEISAELAQNGDKGQSSQETH